jgi:hypothetical protein
MDDAAEQPIPAPLSRPRTGVAWDALRFLLHLAAVYAIVKFCTPSLAGWTRGWLLPLLQAPTSSGSFEFFFSHLFAFSFIPAFLTGLVNARFKHKIAQYVWLVPTVILIYKIARFSTAVSVLYGNPPSTFDHYFGGDFLIPEWHDWKDFWTIASSNPDMSRGMDQFYVHRSVLRRYRVQPSRLCRDSHGPESTNWREDKDLGKIEIRRRPIAMLHVQ